jgi:GT2 family glycosyltransferase
MPILHALAIPRGVPKEELPLYYRGVAAVMEEGLKLARGVEISFDTYMNALSIEKWKKYTSAQKFFLNLEIKGKIEVGILSLSLPDGKYERRTIRREVVETAERSSFTFSLGEESGERVMAAFSLRSLSDEAVLYGGRYSAEIAGDVENDVEMALDICTYKREQYIDNTIRQIQTEIWDNPGSRLNGHLTVFLVDNAKTIIPETYGRFKDVRLCPNKNLGGAGGFTRGMIEALAVGRYTQLLVLDDDARLFPGALERIYSFLRLLKPEFADRLIGGAMFNEQKRAWQLCGSSSRNKEKIVVGKAHLDMLRPDKVVFNEIEEPTQYNGWWLCCIPLDRIKANGLPLPIFIHGDDVEYGLRNNRPTINLNGIAVWHEYLGARYTPVYDYYDLRNQLYICALHQPDMEYEDFKRLLDGVVHFNLLTYRYLSVELNIMAINDFMHGLKWLATVDAEAMHQKLCSLAHKFVPAAEMPMALSAREYELSKRPFKESALARRKRRITLNGHLLPPRRTVFTRPRYVHPGFFYRAKLVFTYDEQSRQAFLTRRNLLTSFKLLCSYVKACLLLKMRFNKLRQDMKNDWPEVTSLASWEKIIGPRQEAQ